MAYGLQEGHFLFSRVSETWRRHDITAGWDPTLKLDCRVIESGRLPTYVQLLDSTMRSGGQARRSPDHLMIMMMMMMMEMCCAVLC